MPLLSISFVGFAAPVHVRMLWFAQFSQANQPTFAIVEFSILLFLIICPFVKLSIF